MNMSTLLIILFFSEVFADDLQLQLDILKNELQALKDTRQRYNDRLQELETEIHREKFDNSGLDSLRIKRASTQGKIIRIIQVYPVDWS